MSVVTLFRSRLRTDIDEEYHRMAERMLSLASGMPGFVSFKSFASEDGERISVVEFASEDQQRAWREHPEHRRAQGLGRERFYESYRVQVLRGVREYAFGDDAARVRRAAEMARRMEGGE